MVVHLTAELMGSKICSLMLLDDQKRLVIKATQSLSEEYRKKPPVTVEGSVSGRAVINKKPITVRDITIDRDFKYPDIAREQGLKSLICVPMMIKDRVIGVLNCYTTVEYPFTNDEVKALCGAANQAAVVIENTQLLADKAAAMEALKVRKVVERAKGILMKRHKVEEDKAYRMLQKQSMEKRRSLRDIAEAIIVSEEIAA